MSAETKQKWVIDPSHSELVFKIRHLMITNVKGQFKEFDASIYTTNDDFQTAEVDCTVNAASIDTGDATRDAHVKGPDFFDVEQFPQINFVADTYTPVDNDGSFDMWGNLTIKGITHKIKLNVEFGGIMKDPWGNEKAGLTINGKINRKDWGLVWNAALETGGMLLADDVQIQGEIQLSRSL